MFYWMYYSSQKCKSKPQKYHLTLVRIPVIKKTGDQQCWQGCSAKGTLVHCCWECQLVGPITESNMEASQKIRTTMWSSNPIFGYLSKGTALFTINSSQDTEATEVSINRWVDRDDVIYTYTRWNKMLKKEILQYETTWMGLKGIMSSEIALIVESLNKIPNS